MSFAQGKTSSSPGDEALEPASAARPVNAESSADAQKLLRASHAAVMRQTSIRADILEVAHLGSPPLKLTGRYVSAGIKLRLEYEVELPGAVRGKLTEVCDGDLLWSWMQLPQSQRVTRRDVRQILAAAQQAAPHLGSVGTVDLALGGLPALLTSVERSFAFEQVKEATLDEQQVYVLSGRWTPEMAEQLGGDRQSPKFPPYLPDGLRLVIARQTLMPLRLTYFKLEQNKPKVLLDLRLQNLVLDGPVAAHEFDFTPPDDTEPEDVTRQYLDQLALPSSEADGRVKEAAGNR